MRCSNSSGKLAGQGRHSFIGGRAHNVCVRRAAIYPWFVHVHLLRNLINQGRGPAGLRLRFHTFIYGEGEALANRLGWWLRTHPVPALEEMASLDDLMAVKLPRPSCRLLGATSRKTSRTCAQAIQTHDPASRLCCGTRASAR